MQTKLTLRLEKQLVDLAKEYASSQGKSVSKIQWPLKLIDSQ